MLTKNNSEDKGTVLLSCVEKAKEIGAKFFQVPLDVWNKLTQEQQWNLNVEFLRKGVEKSATFIVETGSTIKENSFLYKEIDYLLKNWYQWLEDFSALIKR